MRCKRLLCSGLTWIFPLATLPALQINEIRIDQPGDDNDEYFELKGDPGESLDGLAYIVLGDHSGDNATKGSGVIEFAVSLDGLAIPDSGLFLGVEVSFTLAPELVTEEFDDDFGLFTEVRGLTTEDSNLHWVNTNKAGGDSPGEFGGIFNRTADAGAHLIADLNIGDVSRLDELTVTGKFFIAANNNHDGWIEIGFTNLTLTDQNPISENHPFWASPSSNQVARRPISELLASPIQSPAAAAGVVCRISTRIGYRWVS